MIVRELVTRLGFSADETRVRRFGRAVDGLRLGLVAAAAAMGAASGAAVRLATGTAQLGNDINRLSQLANTTPRDFQRMAAATETVGIEQEKLSDILKDVNDRVGDFLQTGGGPMADFFENIAPQVGVTAEMFRDLSGPEALQLYVQSLQDAGLSQQQMTFYMEAMASDSTLLIPLLQDNAAAMNALGDAAESAGRVMDEDAIRASVEFTRAQRDLRWAMDGLRIQIGSGLIPAMLPLLQRFGDFVAANREIIGQRVAEFFDRVAGAAQNLTGLAMGLWEGIAPLIEAFNNLPEGVKAAAAALAFFMLPMGRLKGLLIGGAILAVLEDIGAWMSGNASVIGDLIGPYEEFADVVSKVVEALGGLETIISVLVGIGFARWLTSTAVAFRALGAALLANPIGLLVAAIAGGAFLVIQNWDKVGPAIEAAVNWAMERFEALRARVETVAEFIRTSANNIAEGWETFRDNIGGILDWIGERFDALTARVQAFIDTIRNIRDTVSDAFTFEGDTPVDRRGRPVEDGGGGASGMFDPASFSVPSPSGPTVESAQGGAGVTNINTANAQATFSITVPPGTTSEQVAFIESTVERTLQREINNAALALEA